VEFRAFRGGETARNEKRSSRDAGEKRVSCNAHDVLLSCLRVPKLYRLGLEGPVVALKVL
jgi:hypothetical protein